MAKHNELGQWGEQFACKYLQEKGYIICERDWKWGKRDIDIIAYNAQHTLLVFVEVKTRAGDTFGSPAQAVDKRKAKSIAAAAHAYVKEHDITDELRFDILSIVGTDATHAIIEHIEDAFNPLLLY